MKDPEVHQLIEKTRKGDFRTLARAISLVENNSPGAEDLLEHLPARDPGTYVIGITGPPGAGKSTLVSALVNTILEGDAEARIGILAVDPTSPFTHGSILGDRLRMTDHFNDPRVFIRSIATRGALGGLSAKTPQITDVMLASGFSHIIIETVGVGQSELEIAALADTTVVVFVPESGDEIQTIKSGIMEIADIFVVNKCDREGADRLARSLTATLHERPSGNWQPPVLLTTATQNEGTHLLLDAIKKHHGSGMFHGRQSELLQEKALRILQQQILHSINTTEFITKLKAASETAGFNIYKFVRNFVSKSN
jgi:LAO/AO transport system kinase